MCFVNSTKSALVCIYKFAIQLWRSSVSYVGIPWNLKKTQLIYYDSYMYVIWHGTQKQYGTANFN